MNDAENDSPLARVAGVFASPGPTFESIARRPGWVLPLLISTILSIAATAAIVPRLDFESVIREKMAERHTTIPEDRMEQIIATQKKVGPLFGYASSLLAPTVFTLVLALVLWLAFKAFGWETTFRQSFGVTAHALLPSIFGSMLLIFFATREDVINPADIRDMTHANAGFLVDRHANPVLHALAGSIDLISIWMFCLLMIGFAAAAKVSRRKAAILIGSLWGILILGKAAWAAVFH